LVRRPPTAEREELWRNGNGPQNQLEWLQTS